MTETIPLSSEQLLTLMQHGPVLDTIAAPLSDALQARLLDPQKRAGHIYAAGSWEVPGRSEPYIVIAPKEITPPTRQEAQSILGEAYLALEEKKSQLKGLMDSMGLTPSALRKDWPEHIGQTVASVLRWFP